MLRDLAQRHVAAAGRRHQDARRSAPRLRARPAGKITRTGTGRSFSQQVVATVPPSAVSHDVLRRVDGDAGARQRAAVEHDLQLRHAGVAIELEVDDARHLAAGPRRTCSSVVFITSRSVPKIFSTTWPRTPLTASSTLSLIGCEKLKLTPGISVSEARIASTSRSFVQPGRHLSSGVQRARTSRSC